MNELYEVRAKWYDLGVQLRMKTSDLDAIETEHPKNSNVCLRRMLSVWLTREVHSPPTWQTVVDALSSPAVGRPDVAENINLKYCTKDIHEDFSKEYGSKDKPFSVTETQVESLEREFTKLKHHVCESVQSQPVEVFKLRLTSIRNGEIHMGFLKELIHNKPTVVEIPFHLNYYLNFLNYSLLQHILDKFGDEHLQKKMDEYRAKVRLFLEQTLVRDFIRCWQKHKCPPQTEQLCFIVLKTTKNWETCTQADLENLRDTLAYKLFLPNFTLVFDKASCEGCLTVTYSTSSSLVTQLQTTIKESEVRKVFSNMEIETISVDGVVCYDSNFIRYIESNPMIHELMSTPVSPVSPVSRKTRRIVVAAKPFSVAEVKSQMESLENEFLKLKDDVCESVLTQPVDVFKFRLTSLRIGEVEHHMDYLKEIIRSTNTVVDILVELNGYLNFLNHGLLQHLLDKFENEQLQKRMDKYKVKLEHFFKHTQVCHFIDCWQKHRCQPPVEQLQHFIELKTTKNWETCTLQDLEDLKDRLATKLFLPKFIFVLEKASEGCLAVTFSVPPSLVAKLQRDIKRMKDFGEMEIEIITVDGVVCYTTPLKQLYTSRSLLQPLSDSKPKPLLPFRLARIEKHTQCLPHQTQTGSNIQEDTETVAKEISKLKVTESKHLLPFHLSQQTSMGSVPQEDTEAVTYTETTRELSQLKVMESKHKPLLPFRLSQHETSMRSALQEDIADIVYTKTTRELSELEVMKSKRKPISLARIEKQILSTSGMDFSTAPHTSYDPDLDPDSDSDSEFKPSDSNPTIHAAMYTPVSAAIVEQVFKSAPHNPPTTVTGLYSAYVLMRLEQHLSEHPEYSDMNMKVRTLADLPERVLGDLQQLCRLAYEGVSQQVIVFSSLPEGVSTLGLLQTVPQVYDEGEDRVSYKFLHYTVQEFLAALHLSHLQPQQLMTIIDTNYMRMVKTEYGREYYEATQLKTTFQFLAGITKLEPFPVDFLSDMLEKDGATMYRWLYESQNQSLLTSVLGSGERQLRLSYSATTTDYFAAGYCLAHSNCRWTVNFDFVSVDDVSVEFLSKGCNHQIPETDISSQLVSASFRYGGSITAEGVGHFLTIPNSLLQHIQLLDLHGNKLDRRGCELLAEGVQRMPCLEKLVLSWNSGIGCGGAVQLVSSLHSRKLRELDMIGTGISDPDFECLASYIHSTTSLEVLWIGGNEISFESIDSVCKALSANSSMRRLWLLGSHLTTFHCVCLGQLLRNPIHCQIEKLDLSLCSLTSDGVGKVMSGLSHNHTLRELDLSWNQIGLEGAVSIAKMLKTNRSLKRLYLGWCGIGSSGGVELGAALERNKTLRYLNLSGNALGDDGVRGLCVGLENNSSLEKLWLRCDESLGEEGVSLLLKCLEEKNTSLKDLGLPEKFKRDISSELESRVIVSWW